MTVRTRRVAGVLLAVMGCSLAAWPAVGQASSGRPRRSAAGAAGTDTTFAFDRQGTITVDNGDEDIVVTGTDDAGVHVWSQSGLTVQTSGGAARIEVAPRLPFGAEHRIELTVPRGVHVVAHTRSGGVTIRSTRGDVEASALDGDIQVRDVAGINAQAVNGDILVAAATGTVRAQATSGAVTLTDVRGDIDIGSVSGDLTIKRAVSRRVNARTTSGEVTFDGALDANGVYVLASHSGDVTLAIPRNTGAQVDASTWSGSVNSDFPIRLQPGQVMLGQTGQGNRITAAKHYTFQIGAGGGRVTVESFSGDITINSRG